MITSLNARFSSKIKISSVIRGLINKLLKNITKGEIQISFVGFLTQKVSVKGKSFLEIKMENDQKLLDEVVVVGYGTMRKSDVTGAVSRANIQAFEKSPNTNLLQSLQGTVPSFLSVVPIPSRVTPAY